MNVILSLVFALASFLVSFALSLGPLRLVLAPRPGGRALPAVVLFVVSLAAPAFWLADAPVLGLQAALMTISGPSWELSALSISCSLGLAANASFLLGLLVLLTPWRAWARRSAAGALALGAVSLLPVAGELLVVLPGFVLWLASFEYLRRVAAEQPEAAEGDGRLAVTGRSAPRRCGNCHEGDAARARACPTCGVELHEECWLKAGECPTLGCAVRVQRLAA